MGQAPGDPAMKSRTSDESNEKQLQLAREQGASYEQALLEMIEDEAQGAETKAGDVLIAYAIEEAEGMYEWQSGKLVWRDPTDENAHIEIVVRDARDGRFIPGLEVRVTVTTADGTAVGTHVQPFLWHPWLHHYGRNWTLPGAGEYHLAVHVEPAGYMRHDKVNGDLLAAPVDVEWSDVRIETGQKRS